MTSETKQAEARRLAWRCRRGLLELDIVLQRFVASEFIHLDQAELTALDALLELPDNDFWDLLVNIDLLNIDSPSTDLSSIDLSSIDSHHLNQPIDLETKKVLQKIQSMHQER